MPRFKSLLTRLYTPLVDSAPEIFLGILKRKYVETVVSRLEIGLSYSLNSTRCPSVIHGFEDLSFLFWPTPVNRGALRQDIDEAAALYRTVSRMEHRCGIEIGRYSGGSTILLAAAVGPEGRLVSIDIAPQDDQSLSEVLSRCGLLERVELVTGDANVVTLHGDVLYDFAFIDGDHSYEGARRDHNRWGARVKRNGYIIHHDMSATRAFATQHSALAKLRAEILKVQTSEIRLVDEVGSMCFFQRTASTWSPV